MQYSTDLEFNDCNQLIFTGLSLRDTSSCALPGLALFYKSFHTGRRAAVLSRYASPQCASSHSCWCPRGHTQCRGKRTWSRFFQVPLVQATCDPSLSSSSSPSYPTLKVLQLDGTSLQFLNMCLTLLQELQAPADSSPESFEGLPRSYLSNLLPPLSLPCEQSLV